MDTIEDRVKRVCCKVFLIDMRDLTLDTQPEDIDRWDSLGQMNLALELEDEFNVRLEIDDTMELTSIKAIIEVITRLTQPPL